MWSPYAERLVGQFEGGELLRAIVTRSEIVNPN